MVWHLGMEVPLAAENIDELAKRFEDILTNGEWE